MIAFHEVVAALVSSAAFNGQAFGTNASTIHSLGGSRMALTHMRARYSSAVVIASEVEKPLLFWRCRNSSYSDASEILISLQEIIAGALEDL